MLKLNGIYVFLIENMLTFGVIFKFLPGVSLFIKHPIYAVKAIKIGQLEQIKFEISGDTSCMEVQNGP